MHVSRLLLGGACALTLGAVAVAATAPGPVITTPSATKWVAGTGMERGTFNAVLLGDPTKSGMYIMRSRLPAGTVFAPHTHDETENVTVISGTLWVGLGKTMDKSKMMPLSPGTFATVPANFPHYAMAKTDTVIQIEGMGPETMVEAK